MSIVLCVFFALCVVLCVFYVCVSVCVCVADVVADQEQRSATGCRGAGGGRGAADLCPTSIGACFARLACGSADMLRYLFLVSHSRLATDCQTPAVKEWVLPHPTLWRPLLPGQYR